MVEDRFEILADRDELIFRERKAGKCRYVLDLLQTEFGRGVHGRSGYLRRLHVCRRRPYNAQPALEQGDQ